MKGFVWLDRPKNDEEIKTLRQNALAENHDIFFPTYLVRKDENIIGYFSVGTPGFPMSPCWFGERLSNRESFGLINTVENIVSLGGALGHIFPVPAESPFHPLMGDLGYRTLGKYELFVKKF